MIREAQAGNAEAFRQLASRFDENILGLALRIGATEAEARRIYRDTMMAIHENLARFHFECAFDVWIFRCAAAVSTTYLRRRKTARPGTLNAALDALTPRERIVLELKHYHRESLENLGEILGITRQAAAQALLSGIRKLQATLQPSDSAA